MNGELPPAWQRLEPILTGAEHWFSFRCDGLDRVPDGPALLVGNHSGGVTIPDTYLFIRALLRERGHQHRPIVLAHDNLFRAAPMGNALRGLGVQPASPPAAAEALASGHKLLVYPGGAWEANRPSRDRDRIDFKGRRGFVRTALSARVPIVPVVAAGAHDGWYVLARGTRIARWLGLTSRFRMDAFPIAIALPTGLHLGPALLPHLPWPSPIHVEVLPPIQLEGDPDDSAACDRGYEQVTSEMQTALTRLARTLPRR